MLSGRPLSGTILSISILVLILPALARRFKRNAGPGRSRPGIRTVIERRTQSSMKEIRVLSPLGMLGYGYPIASFEAGLAKKPHAIAVDAGSTDPGPYYLGAGISFTNRQANKRDLIPMLKAARERNIPLLIGSAGGSGARAHLEWLVDIVKEATGRAQPQIQAGHYRR